MQYYINSSFPGPAQVADELDGRPHGNEAALSFKAFGISFDSRRKGLCGSLATRDYSALVSLQ